MKKALFFIDDVIWLFRDLTRQRPASLFDNSYMKLLLDLHTLYGVKIQLNVFYQTDTFYGNDIFTLDDMTDDYKAEFEACSDWLKFGFHSRQEFPDYPYINASYEHIAEDFKLIKDAVLCFAGEKSFSISTTPHWRPISREACHALYDGGLRMISATRGNIAAEDADLSLLPYGHAGRFLQNRKPETALFIREFGDPALRVSIRGYNNISNEDSDRTRYTCEYIVDSETGLCFKELGSAPSLDVATKKEIEEVYPTLVDREFICYGTHEQYFYSDYYAYQPDYPEKLLLAAKILYENGYEFVFGGDLI